jgi:catechol 2,3-dioxygenase-like lactoylglutathione lyase family enzyme
MGFHHVAITTRDLDATHRFYIDACGFTLVNVDVIPFMETGWARHLFYDTGNGEMLAVWDLHEDALREYSTAISTGLGLPNFVNHIAFEAADQVDLDARKDRWVDNGHDVVRVDHGWCTSIYADDPNGIMVEFCCTTRTFTAEDHARAQERLSETAPAVDPTPPPTTFYVAGERTPALPTPG